MMSGLTPAWSAANSSPVRPNPVAISSKINSTSWRVADLPQVGQVPRIVEAHPARALHDGLDDDRGEFVGVLGELLSNAAL